MSMVGSGHVYFNAATYKKERLTGMLSLMDLQNLPREQFVYFMHRSTEPLKVHQPFRPCVGGLWCAPRSGWRCVGE